MDFPPAFFYKELLDAFPKAKVVLSVRKPDSWHDSVVESTLKAHHLLNAFPANVLVAMDKDKREKMEVKNSLCMIKEFIK